MQDNPAFARLERLERLQLYLREDPGNAALLADAFDCALAAGQHDVALEFVAAAERHRLDAPAWLHRRSHMCIARRDLVQAAALLERVRAAHPDDLAVLHDLAHVRFLAGDLDGCRALLEPVLAAEQAPGPPLEAVQVLWLRATHRLGQVQEGCAWARVEAAKGTLQPAAQGVASLLAIDGEDFAAAESLAQVALAADPAHPEALVASASVALARNETDAAVRALQRALFAAPQDGRTLGTLGLALLRRQDLAGAQEYLEAGLRVMPAHVGSWHALGWTRLLRGDRPGARAAFEQALDLDRNFAESHGAIGLLCALEGNREEAQRHLLLADKLDARNVTGRFARTVLAGEVHDAERLHTLARRLLDRPGFFGGKLADAVEDTAPR